MSLLPKSWHLRLRRGARARLRGSLDLDHNSIPLDVTVRLDMQEGERLAIQLMVPLAQDPPAPGAPQLTTRERAIVREICMGKDTDTIARDLYISPATVRTHVRNAMSKVEAHTRAQLVARLFAANSPYLPCLAEGEDDQSGL